MTLLTPPSCRRHHQAANTKLPNRSCHCHHRHAVALLPPPLLPPPSRCRCSQAACRHHHAKLAPQRFCYRRQATITATTLPPLLPRCCHRRQIAITTTAKLPPLPPLPPPSPHAAATQMDLQAPPGVRNRCAVVRRDYGRTGGGV